MSSRNVLFASAGFALCSLSLASIARAEPPIFFPQGPIVTQAAAPRPPASAPPHAPQVAVPVAVAVPVPAAPSAPVVAQPRVVVPIAAQAPVDPPGAVYATPPTEVPAAAAAVAPTAADAPRPWLAPAAPAPVATADPVPSAWRMFLVMGFVAVLGGAAFYMQRARGGGGVGALLGGAPTGGGLRIIDSAKIGPRAQVVVAEFGGKRFLIGVNDTSIRRLAYLGRAGVRPARAADTPRAADDAHLEAAAPAGGFTEAMRRALASSASQPVAPVAAPHASRPLATTPAVPSVNAADLLASETRDVVDVGAGARMQRVLATREAATSPRPSDVYTRTPGPAGVEEQVAGLTRRRIPRRG